jgi:hypothetical protein
VPVAATPAAIVPPTIAEEPVSPQDPDISAAPAKVECAAAELAEHTAKAEDVPAKPENAAAKAEATVSEAPSVRAVMPQRIDKNLLAFPEPRRVRDKDHLRYVAAQPCLLCSATPSDPHHVRFAQPRAMARKVGDDFTVPLCRKHHRDLHDSGNESAWWHDMGIEPLEIARQLWDESQKHQRFFANHDLDDHKSKIDKPSVDQIG